MNAHPLGLYLCVFAVSFGGTFLLVPLFRWLALRLDIVDRPSDPRKVHARTVPYLGGVPFYLCFLLVILVVEHFFPQYAQRHFYPMAAIGTCIVLMGLYDDIADMGSLKKLIVELVLCAGLFLGVWGTGEILTPFGTVDAAWLALIVAPLWIAGVINAVNFSDGLDGLAAGLVFICAASIFAISLQTGNAASCMMMAYLMGCTLAFLRYNFNPASVFMGDAGALFLGFVLGASTLVQQQKGVTTIALAVPMVVMAVPLLDTVLSFYRRLRRAREGRFFTPDRNHLHHRLLDLGLSQRQVVLALYYISLCASILAYILSVLPPGYSLLVLIFAAMIIAFGVVILRFIEGFAHRD